MGHIKDIAYLTNWYKKNKESKSPYVTYEQNESEQEHVSISNHTTSIIATHIPIMANSDIHLKQSVLLHANNHNNNTYQRKYRSLIAPNSRCITATFQISSISY